MLQNKKYAVLVGYVKSSELVYLHEGSMLIISLQSVLGVVDQYVVIIKPSCTSSSVMYYG